MREHIGDIRGLKLEHRVSNPVRLTVNYGSIYVWHATTSARGGAICLLLGCLGLQGFLNHKSIRCP